VSFVRLAFSKGRSRCFARYILRPVRMSIDGGHNKVLNFWFSEENSPKHFNADAAFDDLIKTEFTDLYNSAVNGDLESWKACGINGYLAFIILIDQFSRNMFRGSEKAFKDDHIALNAAKDCVEKGLHVGLDQKRYLYVCLPFMHSENIEDQEKSCHLLEGHFASKWAISHKNEIEKFGRFPGRNAALSRESTGEEIAFLSKK